MSTKLKISKENMARLAEYENALSKFAFDEGWGSIGRVSAQQRKALSVLYCEVTGIPVSGYLESDWIQRLSGIYFENKKASITTKTKK